MNIIAINTAEKHFPLGKGDGTDSVHTDPVYSYALTLLETDTPMVGTGIVFTIGAGTSEIRSLIEGLTASLVGREIEELMSDFGNVFKSIADDPKFRWLGPHKGMVHLALASITNACYDLWAKSRGVPLWRLLLDLSPTQIVDTLDLSYLEDVLTRKDALEILEEHHASRPSREGVLKSGYEGYDTSIGWFNYTDEQIKHKVKKAVAAGFTAKKLKIGSADATRDIRRAYIVRDGAGDDARVMLDVNQVWSLPKAIRVSKELAGMAPYWIEEPTHPDDVLAHRTLSDAIAPLKIALGEHVSHRVLFKNFMLAKAVDFVQVDCTRVGGVSEFITVSLLARKFNLPVVPHVGDMGQIHQHLVLFNHVAMGHEALFLEYIPHLRDRFLHPALVSDGVYQTPQAPGSSSDFLSE